MAIFQTSTYQEIKETWSKAEFNAIGIEPQGTFFSRNNGVRERLLNSLREIPTNATSMLEIGCLFDPLYASCNLPQINRLHLSDVMFQDYEYYPIQSTNALQVSQDSEGMPNLLSLLSELNLGPTIVVLENVINYISAEDVLALLQSNGLYTPVSLVLGNNFNAAMDSVHSKRFKNSEELVRRLSRIGFMSNKPSKWENSITGVFNLT